MSLKIDHGREKCTVMPVFFGSGAESQYYYSQPGEINVTQVTYETDREILENMLPECFTLNDPYVSVNVCEFTNLGYLYGKTYNLINVNVPVHFKGVQDDVDGDLVLVMFENHGDPIVYGRDTMGYAKIYCDIPRVEHNEGKYHSTAANWDFQFMDMKIDTNKPAADADIMKAYEAKSAGKMNYKYIPRTKERDEDPMTNFTDGEVEYPTMLPKWVKPDDYKYEIRKAEPIYCDGYVEFREPGPEDVPPFHHVYKGLAALKCKRVIGAKRVTYDDPCSYNACYRLR